jgi:GT2 family glycosyltransferase
MLKPVALILLNWNTPVYTANCILALKQYCDEHLFDIIVADNGSVDGSPELLKKRFPGLIYIDNGENLGFAGGNNQGLIYSIEKGYDYSLVINTDTLVDEDIVSTLYAHLNSHPEAAAVQPAIYWMHNKAKIWNGRGFFNQVLGMTGTDRKIPAPGGSAAFKAAEWLTGCCMLIRNTALAESGLFNEQFFLYYEDVELSFRMRRIGYEVHYLPACKIYHEAGIAAKIEAQKKEGSLSPVIHYYISRNRIWFLRKYGNKFYYPVYIITSGFYYVSLLIYFKLRGRNQKAAYLIKGLKEGLFTPKSLIWPVNN